MKQRILLIEDEPALAEMLRYNLEKEGYDVATAADGEKGLVAVDETKPDLILLDWMLPHISGLEVCRQLRRKRDTQDIPVIMLTARGEENDRVRALDVGADDYVTKPFSPGELTARIRALLRRAHPSATAELLTYGGLVMDLGSHRVTRDGKPCHLGPTEFRMLRFLMEHPGRVYSREQLLDAVWGRDIYVEVRTVDVHIRRLRKAINLPGRPDLIRTVRSAGYALDEMAQ
jgi:two-component system phosphate regulon response regulator PhoB